MSETLCGKCGFPIHRYASVRHFGTYVAHEEYECMAKMRAALDEATAALAAATAQVTAHEATIERQALAIGDLQRAEQEASAEREAAVLAMREAAAEEMENRAGSALEGRRFNAANRALATALEERAYAYAQAVDAIRSLPTPTSALDAERERVVREAAPYFVREFRSHWFRTGTAIRDEDTPLVAEQVARARAAAKGGQE